MIYNYPGLEWVIQQRIRDYEYDAEVCIKDSINNNSNRIIQDKAIIQELKRILTGEHLDTLGYIGRADERV